MKCFYLGFLILLLACNAHAVNGSKFIREGGSNTSGGGGGVICDEGTNREQIETLDYYEAFIKYGTTSTGIPSDSSVLSSQVQRENLIVLSHLSTEEKFIKMLGIILVRAPKLQEEIAKYLQRIGSWSEWQNAKLDEFNDSGKKYVLKAGCRYIQLAVRDGDNIRADLEVIKRMPATQRAILMVHEALYFAAKTNDPKLANSVGVRDVISRILTMLTMSEFDVSEKIHLSGLNDEEKQSLGTIPYMNNYEMLELCKVAATMGLCEPNVLVKDLLDRVHFDKIFEGYVDDQLRSTRLSIQSLTLPKRNVRKVYKNLAAVKIAFDDYVTDLKYSESRIYTLPAVLSGLMTEMAILNNLQCDLKNTNELVFEWSPNDLVRFAPELTKICAVTKLSIEAALSRMATGYTREFCYASPKVSRPICPLSIAVPSVKFTLGDHQFIPMDQMDIRMKIEIMNGLQNSVSVLTPETNQDKEHKLFHH